MDTIVLYHAQCTDGAASMWAAWKHFGDDAAYIPVGKESKHQSSIIKKCKNAKDVYMCDVMLEPSDIREILECGTSIHFLDHHISNIQKLFGRRGLGPYREDHTPIWFEYDWETGNCRFDQPDSAGNHRGHIPVNEIKTRSVSELMWEFPHQVHDHCDLEKSGAGITWDFFHDDPRFPRLPLINYIEDFDLWHWGLPEGPAIHAYLSQFNWNSNDAIIEVFEELHGLSPEQMAARGKPIVDYKNQLIERELTRVGRAKVKVSRSEAYDVPIINTAVCISEIGSKMAIGEPFAVLWHLTQNGDVRVSLRSNEIGGEDVQKIAQQIGERGGGHKHAAGTRFRTLTAFQRIIIINGK